jgi:hypothetical protein
LKIITKKQLLSKKYRDKFLDTYPLHYHSKDENGNWVTVYELRGVSSTVKENYETPEEILETF